MWVTILASVVAAYIILAFPLHRARDREPLGEGVSDLPLESFYVQIASQMDTIASNMKPKRVESIDVWIHRPESKLSEALNAKVELALETTKNSSSGSSSKSGFPPEREFHPGQRRERCSIISTCYEMKFEWPGVLSLKFGCKLEPKASATRVGS
ncbi:hypothetical protein V1517DRAFT_335905 [Lipomyces orientalis]|uniref:Uncharacterized protein n=1 Tax=Lipomyces orientalis TaxID=1233043 RepID=A0ACC3TVL3_9ASCO